MLPVRRIDHIVALVRDAPLAIDDYTRRLGFPLSWTLSAGAGWQSNAVWLGNASLELLQPAPESAEGPFGSFFQNALDKHDEGLFMLAFEPAPIDEAIADLRSRGATVTDPVASRVQNAEMRADQRGFTNAFISRRSTAGVNTFLCQYDTPFIPVDTGGGPLKIKKLDHVVIATEDLEDATSVWARNIGLKADASLDRPLGAGFKVARLPIGDSFLELVQPVATEGRFYEQFQLRGEGLFSISLQVEDLDEAVSYLRGNGAKVSDPEPSIWPGARVARINQSSTHGVSIQLIERR